MTTLTLAPDTPRTATEPRGRFRDLLVAEWIKLWSLRSTPWVLGLSALVIIAANLNSAKYTYDHFTAGDPASSYFQVALNDSFTLIAADILMLVAGSVGVIVMVGEYTTGMIRTTVAAVPDRRAMLVAKACVLTAVMLGYGILVAGASFGLGQAVLSGRHIGLSITHPGALRFVAAAALFAPICALIGMALGVLIRHGAATVAATVLVLFFLPSFFTDTHHWTADLSHAMPLTAWRRLAEVDMTNVFISHYPATVGGAWLTFAAWPLVSVLIATIAIHRRDL
ncbi:ABC transporter permease [Kitasatospora kifunensis]|uniref:ABC-type transport system involved in multi-copper enzyme maturation permease subunit n=1 Tax=Kitasatospora kifunensis TaxID=58351 RepID=A0A7W7VY24_KITKI|nr:ABC transporter permease [Kitasatospora kifunensis]MBB4926234.1 ABC-type transport system involved in multi-copper enzyme maturation permease subunit [Kitasatospora kifunensis]